MTAVQVIILTTTTVAASMSQWHVMSQVILYMSHVTCHSDTSFTCDTWQVTVTCHCDISRVTCHCNMSCVTQEHVNHVSCFTCDTSCHCDMTHVTVTHHTPHLTHQFDMSRETCVTSHVSRVMSCRCDMSHVTATCHVTEMSHVTYHTWHVKVTCHCGLWQVTCVVVVLVTEVVEVCLCVVVW